MGWSHTWFGTKADAELIIAWLNNAGARQLNGDPLEGNWAPDGGERVIQFSSIGPVVFWPGEISLPDVGDNSPRAKRAILASIGNREHPGRPEIDVDQSTVAGLKLPEFRDGRY